MFETCIIQIIVSYLFPFVRIQYTRARSVYMKKHPCIYVKSCMQIQYVNLIMYSHSHLIISLKLYNIMYVYDVIQYAFIRTEL